jgi:signal transduction histidine kinase
VDVEREGAGIAIRVRDHGLGIPAAEHREILRKFVRGTAARTTGIKGTGIGLAMVKHIVDAHGGSLRLEGAQGRGSTFSILLPAGV